MIHGGGTIRGDVANPMVNQGTHQRRRQRVVTRRTGFHQPGPAQRTQRRAPCNCRATGAATGVISNNASYLSLGGTFTTASLNTLKTINGTNILSSGAFLINTNNTLTLSPGKPTGSLLMQSGTIRGGTLATTNGAQFLFGAANLRRL